jgi:FkbM family methyltransferase
LAERVFPVRAAVAAAPGKLVLCLHPQLGRCEIAESGGVQGFGPAADLPRVEVPACSLASLLAERQVAPEEVGLVWSDTQGYEREVIAGGEALWRVGAPLFLELWPRGLGAHGGVAAFLAAAGRCFRGFVSEEDLARTPFPAPRPIGELAARLGALEGNAHTDALLVPERAEAV